MIIRMKDGGVMSANGLVLLDYLGIKKDTAGMHKVSGDVELIANIPLQMKSDEGFAWTLSTFDLDRHGERIDPMGWDFKRFMENPVVEWSHRYDIPAIGKIENLISDSTGLHGVIVFNGKEYDPFAWSIEQRIKAGSIRAGSVGFRVMEIEIPSKEDSKDGTCLIFRKQELLEFSICNVPANPYALSKQGIGNREWGIGKEEKGDNASPFWGCLINNF